MDNKSSLSTEANAIAIEKPDLGTNATQEDIFYKGFVDHAGIEAAAIDPVAEKKLLRKIDIHLIPILWLLFLCAFIDRINIGNARIQGLEEDLGMAGNDYNIALFTFFITYILFEVPSNILLKKLRPSVFLSSIIAIWGCITIGMGCTQSFSGLVACRALIGFFEAGFFPGCIYLISMYYKRHELQWRVNLFFCASIIAGAFSGLLAYAIAHMDGIQGYAGWRWIFIIEGIATVVIAVGSYFIIPDWPHTAKFLTEDERSMLSRRLALDVERATMNHWDKHTAWRCFGDIKIYLGTFMYMGIVQTGYATSFFTPTILKQLGWTSVRAQVMSIPIFIVATILALCTALLTDRLKHRFAFIVTGCCISTIGYAILLNMIHVPVGARYFALFLITGGGYIAQPVVIVWLSNNVSGHYKRGVSSAMQIGFGNIGGIVASVVYLPTQAPRYPLGFGMGLGFLWMCVGCAVVFLLFLMRENKLRDAGKRNDRLQLPTEVQNNLGDEHPSFRFSY
ncbi:hypothetical protein PMZ80_009852 [Knufia obscura]|uniref:Major facilitator superfamily (MFS) profile domain-containing protein n=2 Tax=Knufia TaxID=430999 RepID=A0AAN8EPX5_9EURO|nr:hypothetical protein PMZ80_009852 [Knufia obscura]KAK5955947.1 hypothetical protein OHC33_002520 [Knufia fluminis]